jgi:hypothetical protein
MKVLLSAEYVGADAEWKNNMFSGYGGKESPVAVLQLSSEKDAFLIDMISLR